MKKNYSEFLNPRSPKNGFTLIEIMISISIFGIIIATSISALSNRKGILNLEDAQASIINALGQAQNRAVTGVGTTNHGVHIYNIGESDINTDYCHNFKEACIAIFKCDNFDATCEDECKDPNSSICKVESLPCSVSTDQSIIEFNRLSGGSENTVEIKIDCAGVSSKYVNVTKDGAIIAE